MEQQDFKNALRHLRKAITEPHPNGDESPQEIHHHKNQLRFLLVQALLADDPISIEAEIHLRQLIEIDAVDIKIISLHLLAQFLLRTTPGDLEDAKAFGMLALNWRTSELDGDDKLTHESISLMAAICKASDDSNEILFRDLLPKQPSTPKTKESSAKLRLSGAADFHIIPSEKPYASYYLSPDANFVMFDNSDVIGVFDLRLRIKHFLTLPTDCSLTRYLEFSEESRTVSAKIFAINGVPELTLACRMWRLELGQAPSIIIDLITLGTFDFCCSPNSERATLLTESVIEVYDISGTNTRGAQLIYCFPVLLHG